VELASSAGIPCVEINQQRTGISNSVDYQFEMGCTEALEEIMKRLDIGN